jgi:hypothetical protein
MGAGKSHTMQWLKSHGHFPLERYVQVDPDQIRLLLPETQEHMRRNPDSAGYLTQKETGCTRTALAIMRTNTLAAFVQNSCPSMLFLKART